MDRHHVIIYNHVINSSRLIETYEAMNHAIIYKLFSAQWHIWGHEPCYHIWTLLGSVTHMRPWTMLSYMNSSKLGDTYEAMNHAIMYIKIFSAQWHIWSHEPCYHIWTLLGSVTHMRPWTMLSYINSLRSVTHMRPWTMLSFINSSQLSDTYDAIKWSVIYQLFSVQWLIRCY